MSTAMTSTGIIVAGTADGRMLIGCGGYKGSPNKGGKKKRSRKWDGLNAEEELVVKVAEGPVVALIFDDSNILTVSTLLGVISRHTLSFDVDKGSVTINKIWQRDTREVKKVNALVVDDKRIVVGGLTAQGKGIIEIWKKDSIPTNPE
ncbi:hypothetical protein H0H93_010680 [Arthromyces matolae]|nr:hypothetical protein H0H93_010680 [Arthromyces matolae]